MFHECHVVRGIGCTLEYDANMPPGPVKSLQIKYVARGAKTIEIPVAIDNSEFTKGF